MSSYAHPTPLRALGFCGIDDSISPSLLSLISRAYPLVEWGVLFRPDLEGTPRYASMGYVRDKLLPAYKACNGSMRLAAHLCGARVNEVLKGDDAFVGELSALGFRRVQINATAVNGVDTSDLPNRIGDVVAVMRRHPGMEFILQRSDETRPLWEGVAASGVANMSMLFDESKGTGALLSSYSAPPAEYEVGYAGGIGPKTVVQVLASVAEVASHRSVWIDMESSLRSTTDGADVFDVTKCYDVIEKLCKLGYMKDAGR
jgi:hypothetical protein